MGFHTFNTRVSVVYMFQYYNVSIVSVVGTTQPQHKPQTLTQLILTNYSSFSDLLRQFPILPNYEDQNPVERRESGTGNLFITNSSNVFNYYFVNLQTNPEPDSGRNRSEVLAGNNSVWMTDEKENIV